MNVAKLIGLKTVLNEFYAYQQMAVMLLNNQLSVCLKLWSVSFNLGLYRVAHRWLQFSPFAVTRILVKSEVKLASLGHYARNVKKRL